MDMQAVRNVLIEEARELLAAMEQALLEVETHGADSERINAIFRAAHTLKGSSGMFNLQLVVGFTHLMENLLVRVRTGEQAIDAQLISLLLSCGDYLSRLFDNVADGLDEQDPDPQTRALLSAELQQYLTNIAPLSAAEPLPGAALNTHVQHWRIELRPEPQVFLHGLDPIAFVNYLAGLGEVLCLEVLQDTLPTLATLEAESCYLGFVLEILSSATQADIEQALEFIAQDCAIHISQQPPAELTTAPTWTPELTAESVQTLVEPGDSLRARSQEQVFIKVDARKLDQLIDSVGELVTRSARSRTLAEDAPREAVKTFMEEVDSFVEQIRDRALSLRMAPVNEVFQRFPRVVRDVARDLGKQVDLNIRGADTELDKSLLDKLNDPLLHIVRNALDHGLEPADVRQAMGKPALGTLSLNAYHDSGCVVLEISDDGRGLDAQKIRGKAIERGLINADSDLDEQAIYHLIFEAGFSTAEQVTDLSGRGVGMDVVRRSIEALRGTIEINSHLGSGTTFRIRLPLTLSIIDGFQVVVGEAHFVIPLEQVVECLELGERSGSNQIVSLRDSPLAFVRLAELFNIPAQAGARECLVVVQHGTQRTGIVVDRFAGELQAVIKPLNPLLRSIRGLGGSTILGDGSVAMILDIHALLDADRRGEALTRQA